MLRQPQMVVERSESSRRDGSSRWPKDERGASVPPAVGCYCCPTRAADETQTTIDSDVVAIVALHVPVWGQLPCSRPTARNCTR